MRPKSYSHSIADRDRIVIEFERICDQVGPAGLLDLKQDSLLVGAVDGILQHGLKDPVQGYWCLVRTITHSTTLKALEAFVKYLSSSHQKGLAWTFYTMEEGSFEFYLNSVVQDTKVMQQHYLDKSVLRNPRLAQRVITAVSTLRSEAAAMYTSMESSLVSEPGLDQSSSLETIPLTSPVDSGVALVESDSSSSSDGEKNESSDLAAWNLLPDGSSNATEGSPASVNTLIDNKGICQNPNTPPSDNKLNSGIITQGVCRRPKKKKSSESVKRVSFHQDSNDIETKPHANLNLFVEGRYSWAGEDDSFFHKGKENIREIKSEIYERKGLSSSLSIFDSELGIEADCESTSTLDGTKNNIEMVCEKLTKVVKQSLGLKPKEPAQNVIANFGGGMGERGAPEGQEDPVSEPMVSSEYERLLAAHQRNLAAMRSSVLTDVTQTSDSDWSLDTLDRFKRSPFIKYPSSQRSSTPKVLREAPSKTSLVKRFLRSIPTRKPLPVTPTLRRTLYISGFKPDPMLSQYLIKEVKEEIELNTMEKKHGGDETVTETMKNALMKSVLIKKGELIYKVYCVATIDGEPQLAVLTDSALYITGLTSNKCYTRKNFFAYSTLHSIVAGPGQQTVVVGRGGGAVALACATGRSFVTHLALAVFRATRSHLSVRQMELPDMAPMRRALLARTSVDKDESLVYYKHVKFEDTVSVACEGPGLTRSGHLMYRPHYHTPWIPGYILLKGGFLYVFSELGQQSPQHVLSLHRGYFGGCRRVFNSNRPHTFEMLPFSQRGIVGTFQFAAADDFEASGWLQAFIEASAAVSDSQGEVAEDTPVEGRSLLLTSHHLVTLRWPNKILSCTRLSDIHMIRIATTCCLLEISCREVSENGGDWIIYFLSLEAISAFLDTLFSLRPQLKQMVAESWDSDLLLAHCIQKSEQIRNGWDQLLKSGM